MAGVTATGGRRNPTTASATTEADRPSTPSVHAGLVCHGLPLLSTGRAPAPATTACCTSVPPTIAVTVGSACAACAAGKLSLRRSAAGRQQSALRAGLSWHGVGHRVRLGEVEQPVDAEFAADAALPEAAERCPVVLRHGGVVGDPHRAGAYPVGRVGGAP